MRNAAPRVTAALMVTQLFPPQQARTCDPCDTQDMEKGRACVLRVSVFTCHLVDYSLNTFIKIGNDEHSTAW